MRCGLCGTDTSGDACVPRELGHTAERCAGVLAHQRDQWAVAANELAAQLKVAEDKLKALEKMCEEA